MESGAARAFELLGLQPDVVPDEVELAFGRLVGPFIQVGDFGSLKLLDAAKRKVLEYLANERREFDELLQLLESTTDNIFILGRAGTGKSALLSDYLAKEFQGVAACAFTGVAARNIDAPTIHSLFRIAGGPGELKGGKKLDNAALSVIKQIQTLIIDEISMAPGWLIDEVDKTLRMAKAVDKPFGGARLVFVGDPLQLAPFIGNADEELKRWVKANYQTMWFFDSHVFQDPDFDFKMFELTNVFRQDEPELIEVLDAVRVGKFEGKHESFINKRVLPRPTDEEVLTIATKNEIVDSVNKARLEALPGEEVTFFGFDSSIIPGKKFMDKDNPYPVPIELKLKVGAQVMFTKNDDQNGEGLQRRWVNGTLGIVEAFSADKSSVFVRIDDSVPIEVKRSTWARYEYQVEEVEHRATGRKMMTLVKRAVAEYLQTPLSPAWAVTINKSQGKTYDRVHIDLGLGAWGEGQAYVALSRVRKYAGMTLEKPLTRGDIKTSKDAMAFIEECQDFHNARNQLT